MPIYEYECKNCGEHFEVEQRMTDDALTKHDACGGDVVKVFSSAGIVFKGSGFHKTDARKSTTTKSSSSKSSTSSTSESSTTTKPADTGSSSGSNAAPATKKTDTK